MRCVHDISERDIAYRLELDRIVAERRIPIAGTLDLTWRCNLRCTHCYLGSLSDPAGVSREFGEEPWRRVIGEIAEAGCLYLLLSGGEPLLRPDFSRIYRHAKESGFLVTVFTNGTLVGDAEVELFSDLPPETVEISIYGANAETCDAVTGVPGSFDRCMAGIEALATAGVRLTVKTVLLKDNVNDIEAMRQIAEGFGVPFRFDPVVLPRFDGDRSPIHLRIDPETAVEAELSDPERWDGWCRTLERFPEPVFFDTLYACGAGDTDFYIDPFGNLKPCLMLPEPAFPLSGGSFDSGWWGAMKAFNERTPPAGFPCNGCDKLMACDFCPSAFRLETGSETLPSAYICRLAERRYQAIRNTAGSKG